jgi:hypothetical protein
VTSTNTEPLPSWNDTAARQAIMQFVQAVSDADREGQVPTGERVAVFDNDGTLWCEQPMPIQADFILRRLAAMADQDPGLRPRQPWQAAYTRDYGWLGGVITRHYHGDDRDLPVLAAGVLQAFAGITVEDFEAQADSFLRSAQHPTLGRGYLACAYAPMVELLGYLEANGFTNYIASGGGRDFMRPISQEVYGVPRQRVIGSSATLAWQPDEGAAGSSASPSWMSWTTARPSRSGSGAGWGGGRCWPRAIPTVTCRCWRSPSSPAGRRCGCWCCTTIPSASSTTPLAPSGRWRRPRRRGGRWSASRTTG